MFPNVNSECLTRMGRRDDPWLRRTLKYGGRRLAEFMRTLIFFGEVAYGWGRRRALRRPTILRPRKRLPPRIDVSFVISGPNRISPTCGRRRSSGIFAHGLPERRYGGDDARCGRVHPGVLPRYGRQSPRCPEVELGPRSQRGLWPLLPSGNARCHSTDVPGGRIRLG